MGQIYEWDAVIRRYEMTKQAIRNGLGRGGGQPVVEGEIQRLADQIVAVAPDSLAELEGFCVGYAMALAEQAGKDFWKAPNRWYQESRTMMGEMLVNPCPVSRG